MRLDRLQPRRKFAAIARVALDRGRAQDEQSSQGRIAHLRDPAQTLLPPLS